MSSPRIGRAFGLRNTRLPFYNQEFMQCFQTLHETPGANIYQARLKLNVSPLTKYHPRGPLELNLVIQLSNITVATLHSLSRNICLSRAKTF
jgi:hypothetical protein